MQTQVIHANEPNIVLGEDGLPLIMSSAAERAISADKIQSKDNDAPELLEDDADREKRELAISMKLWSKARRMGPPRKADMNPMIIKSGRYVSQAECHAACKWFVEQGETSKGAWLHKYPKWTKWGHEIGRDKREVVERDQMVMRILRNYSAKDGPTDEQRDEALTLYQRLLNEQKEDKRSRKRLLLDGSNKLQNTSTDVGGLVSSTTMAGVDVPLGWDEENATMGAQEDVEADVQQFDDNSKDAQPAVEEENDNGKDDQSGMPKVKRRKKK